MKILDRYIIRQLIAPFIGSLCVVMFVLVMDFLLDILNLIISKGVPPWAVGELFVFNLAWMITLAVPMASLVASLMVYGRMAGDQEIVAMSSVGLPLQRLMAPGIFLMALLSILMIFFNDSITPIANYRAKQMMVEIHRKKPMAAIQARVFIEDFPNMVLYTDKVDDRAGKLYGIKIFEKQRTGKPRTIIAPEGEVKYDPRADAIKFTLFNGEIHEIDPESPDRYTKIKFSKQVINISDLGTKLGEQRLARRGDREMTGKMLKKSIQLNINRIDSVKKEMSRIAGYSIDSIFNARSYKGRPNARPVRRALLKERRTYGVLQKYLFTIHECTKRINKLRVELNKNYSLAFACIFFLLVSAPVGAWTRKGGLGVAVGLSFGFFLVYWAFLIGGEELADRGLVHPTIGIWSGNAVMFIIAVLILIKLTYGIRVAPVHWVVGIFKKRKQ